MLRLRRVHQFRDGILGVKVLDRARRGPAGTRVGAGHGECRLSWAGGKRPDTPATDPIRALRRLICRCHTATTPRISSSRDTSRTSGALPRSSTSLCDTSHGGVLLDVGADGTWSTAQLSRRGLTCIALDITDHLGAVAALSDRLSADTPWSTSTCTSRCFATRPSMPSRRSTRCITRTSRRAGGEPRAQSETRGLLGLRRTVRAERPTGSRLRRAAKRPGHQRERPFRRALATGVSRTAGLTLEPLYGSPTRSRHHRKSSAVEVAGGPEADFYAGGPDDGRLAGDYARGRDD